MQGLDQTTDGVARAPDARLNEQELPWVVRYALAAHDFGKPLPPHLLMCVQMVRNGFGCAACGSVGR
jgi:hypothetical protein